MTMEEQPVPGGSERILIVDDQDAVIAILSKILEELGYTVLSASTTEDALLYRPRVRIRSSGNRRRDASNLGHDDGH